MPGPAPTPKRELEKRGSWRAKVRPDDLTLDSAAPSPPSTLSKEARAEWKRIVALLAPKGALTQADRAALTTLCELWAEDRALGQMLKKMVMGSTDWKRVNTARMDGRRLLLQFETKFGLTPADRSRVKVVNKKSTEAAGKGRFFNAGSGPVVGKIGA